MLENRKNYESHLEAQLAIWKAEIDVLKAKASRANVRAMVQYDHGIEALQKKHEDADLHLRNLKAATDEAWEGAKGGTEKVWGEVKALFQQTTKPS